MKARVGYTIQTKIRSCPIFSSLEGAYPLTDLMGSSSDEAEDTADSCYVHEQLRSLPPSLSAELLANDASTPSMLNSTFSRTTAPTGRQVGRCRERDVVQRRRYNLFQYMQPTVVG